MLFITTITGFIKINIYTLSYKMLRINNLSNSSYQRFVGSAHLAWFTNFHRTHRSDLAGDYACKDFLELLREKEGL